MSLGTITGSVSGELTTGKSTLHDRRSTDLPSNVHVAEAIVDDPYPLRPGDALLMFKNVRNDPLERLKQRGDINDAQFRAGKAYERDLELAEIGSVKAIDPTKEAVDGGCLAEPLSDLQRRALERLRQAGQDLGLFAESVVRGCLASNATPAQLAVQLGFTTKREQLHYGWAFRLALEYLARLYGTATVSTNRYKIRSATESVA